MSEKIQKIALFTIGSLVMSILLSYLVFAWSEPSQNPPQGNVPAPINVGSADQVKSGKLGVATDGIDTGYGLTVGNSSNSLGIKASGKSYFEKEVFFNTFKISPISATELGVYDSNGNLIVIFDQGT
jgi:hypothetical protein